MEREARWQLDRRALDSQSHEVKEHTEEQDECIAPEAMGPDEARMGRVVFGSTGSMQHHPDVGASEKHEKRTQGRAQRRMQHDVMEGSRAGLKERAELRGPCAARKRTRSRAAPGGRRTTWHDGGTSAARRGMARCSGRPDRDSAPERPRA